MRDHVLRLEQEHPPLDPRAVDYTVRDPATVARRYGRVLDYMARTELEVERNVLELEALLPSPTEVDEYFYRNVWGPQEVQHGLVLDRVQSELGIPRSERNLDEVSLKVRVLGAIAHVTAVQDVVRMLYYLTGMTTERSALLAYHQLHDGLIELGEHAIAQTAVAPIRRQEPGHFAFYQLAARDLWSALSPWQRWLVRRLRSVSFAPVGAGSAAQRAQVGELMLAFGMAGHDDVVRFASTVARLEAELLGARHAGLAVPSYVVDAFADCLTRASAGAAAGS